MKPALFLGNRSVRGIMDVKPRVPSSLVGTNFIMGGIG